MVFGSLALAALLLRCPPYARVNERRALNGPLLAVCVHVCALARALHDATTHGPAETLALSVLVTRHALCAAFGTCRREADEMRGVEHSSAVLIQGRFRGHRVRSNLFMKHTAALRIQKLVRGALARARAAILARQKVCDTTYARDPRSRRSAPTQRVHR